MKNNKLFLGFTCMSDFWQTLSGWKYSAINFLMAFCGAITGFITTYIYDDAKAVYFMAFLVGVDFLTGVFKAMKKGNFTSSRLPRAFVILLAYSLLLCMGWQASKYSVLFIWLPGLIYGGLISTLLVSTIENLYLLGLIKKDLLSKIIEKLK